MSHAEAVTHERLSLPRPRWPSHAPSLLPSIPPPPSPGFFPPFCHSQGHPRLPQDTTPTGAAHRASALSRGTGGPPGGLALLACGLPERGGATAGSRDRAGRGQARLPGMGVRVSGVRGRLGEAASLGAPPCAWAATPAPYPRFPRAAGPTPRPGRSSPDSSRPHGGHSRGVMAAGGGVAIAGGARWLAGLTTPIRVRLGAVPCASEAPMGANGIGRGGCPSLAPIPRATRPPASRISGGGLTAETAGVNGTLRKEGNADPPTPHY